MFAFVCLCFFTHNATHVRFSLQIYETIDSTVAKIFVSHCVWGNCARELSSRKLRFVCCLVVESLRENKNPPHQLKTFASIFVHRSSRSFHDLIKRKKCSPTVVPIFRFVACFLCFVLLSASLRSAHAHTRAQYRSRCTMHRSKSQRVATRVTSRRLATIVAPAEVNAKLAAGEGAVLDVRSADGGVFVYADKATRLPYESVLGGEWAERGVRRALQRDTAHTYTLCVGLRALHRRPRRR